MDDLAIDTIRDYKANVWRIKEVTERSEEVGFARASKQDESTVASRAPERT